MRTSILVISLLMLCLSAPAWGEEPSAATLIGTEQFSLSSKAVGDDFLIQVRLPMGYGSTDTKYPLMYVLDGNLYFGMTYGMLGLMGIGGGFNLIAVHIGYPRLSDAMFLRTRDLTPADSVDQAFLDQSTQQAGYEVTAGGAEAFLRFIETELDPHIRERYRIDGDKAAILGDSFGGLFTYYAFLKQSPAFDRFWLGSPGLIQPDSKLLRDLPALLQKGGLSGQRVYISLGERELLDPFYSTLGANYLEMVKIFEANPAEGLSVHHQIYPGRDHLTVIGDAMMQAMIFLYHDKWPQFRYAPR